jgi:hypothetical protein
VSSPYDLVVDALRRHGSTIRNRTRGITAQCPAHDDRHPSLDVDPTITPQGDATVLLLCRSGECSTGDILGALGLRPADLYPQRQHTASLNGQRPEKQIHIYRDPDRRERYWKIRIPAQGNKKRLLWFEHRNSAGQVVRGIPDGAPRLLYGLPEMLDAIRDGRHIWVVEGESDVDRMASIGEIAVSNRDGAAGKKQHPKWTDEDTAWLKGAKRVTVIADNDESGFAHARHIVKSLTGIVESVRLVVGAVARDKADVSDHLNEGFSLDDLIVLPAAETNGHRPGPVEVQDHSEDDDDNDDGDSETPARRLRLIPANEVPMRRTRWLWNNRIPLGGLTLLAGREGLGKSTVAVELTAQVTRGEMAGEMYGTPRDVVYINSEDARDYTIVPRLVAAGADLSRVLFVNALTPDDTATSIVLPFDTDLLAAAVIERQAVMVVLDAATSVIDGKLDGDKDRQMRQALESIATKVGERTGCAVLGIVHFGKRESSDTGKLILGSIAWSQVARSTIAIAMDTDTGQLVLTGSKSNLAPMDTASLALRIDAATVETPEGPTSVGKVTWLGDTDDDARDLLDGGEGASDRSERNEARDWLRDYLGQGRCKSSEAKRAAIAAGISERTLTRARGSLKVKISAEGFPRVTYWALPARPDSQASEASRLARAGERGGPTVTTAADQHIYSGPTGGPTTGPTVSGPTERATSQASGLTAGPGSYASGDSEASSSPARDERPHCEAPKPPSSDDQWVHAHLTTQPRTIAQLAAALASSSTIIETALARLEYTNHAQCHTQPGKPDGWSLPTKQEAM